jgi:hypothetical protein
VDYGAKVDDWLRMTRRLLELMLMIKTALNWALFFLSAQTTQANRDYGAFHTGYASTKPSENSRISTSLRRCRGYKA